MDAGHARPRQVQDEWVTEFYCPEEQARSLKAEGCTFEVDADFFPRLQRFRMAEQQHRQSPEQLAAAFERGELPTTQRRLPPTLPRRKR
jgi:hypothetical protein